MPVAATKISENILNIHKIRIWTRVNFAVIAKSLKSIRGGTPNLCHSAQSAGAHQAARKLVAWSLKRGQRSGQEEAKMLGTQET